MTHTVNASITFNPYGFDQYSLYAITEVSRKPKHHNTFTEFYKIHISFMLQIDQILVPLPGMETVWTHIFVNILFFVSVYRSIFAEAKHCRSLDFPISPCSWKQGVCFLIIATLGQEKPRKCGLVLDPGLYILRGVSCCHISINSAVKFLFWVPGHYNNKQQK